MYKDGGFDEDGACRVCISAASRRLFTSGCWLPWQPCRHDNATDATCGPVMDRSAHPPPYPTQCRYTARGSYIYIYS